MTNKIKIPHLHKMQLREYQRHCYIAMGEAIKESTQPFFVDVSVGGGKSLLIAALCARFQELDREVLVISRQGEIIEQNAEELWKCGVKNSIYSASLGIKKKAYKILVGTEGTIARALDNDLKNIIPTALIIDEAHMVGFDEDESQYMFIINELLSRNKNMRIIGLTGSPYRGQNSMVGQFWEKCIYKISTEDLQKQGYLVPVFFGAETSNYDLKEFQRTSEFGMSDYSQKELQAMQRKITADENLTKTIIDEVIELTKDRNAVMITGAGRRHLEQIASFLPADSWVIITDKTTTKERRKSLKQIDEQKKKFLLQIGCMTTGYNQPLLDTSVIMRKIGSLTLLIQLLGRIMRILPQALIDDGVIKHDGLVLDYSATMDEMGEIYQNPFLEAAQLAKAKRENFLIPCPICNTDNSKYSRRCLGNDNTTIDGRCEWFWSFNQCLKCNTKNDPTSKECRFCKAILKDPNENLIGKHYTDDDWIEVKKMDMTLTKNAEGILINYDLSNGDKAKEVYFPNSPHKFARAAWSNKFIKQHLHISWREKLFKKTAPSIIKMRAMFDTPSHITHRISADGKSIIHRKRFLSGKII